MDKKQALEIVNRSFNMIFGKPNSLPLETIFSKLAFDIKLPKKVLDSLTHEETWTEILHSNLFITQNNMRNYDKQKGWMLPKQEVKNLKDVITIWKKINYTTTERQYDCINVSECDPIYQCENAYRSSDCRGCKNIVFCDGCANCEFTIASQRTADSGFCLRVDESDSGTNSYNVSCSSRSGNAFFILGCDNLQGCLFCSHIANKKYCISNMQFEEREYFMIKNQMIDWIFKSLAK